MSAKMERGTAGTRKVEEPAHSRKEDSIPHTSSSPSRLERCPHYPPMASHYRGIPKGDTPLVATGVGVQGEGDARPPPSDVSFPPFLTLRKGVAARQKQTAKQLFIRRQTDHCLFCSLFSDISQVTAIISAERNSIKWR